MKRAAQWHVWIASAHMASRWFLGIISIEQKALLSGLIRCILYSFSAGTSRGLAGEQWARKLAEIPHQQAPDWHIEMSSFCPRSSPVPHLLLVYTLPFSTGSLSSGVKIWLMSNSILLQVPTNTYDWFRKCWLQNSWKPLLDGASIKMPKCRTLWFFKCSIK